MADEARNSAQVKLRRGVIGVSVVLSALVHTVFVVTAPAKPAPARLSTPMIEFSLESAPSDANPATTMPSPRVEPLRLDSPKTQKPSRAPRTRQAEIPSPQPSPTSVALESAIHPPAAAIAPKTLNLMPRASSLTPQAAAPTQTCRLLDRAAADSCEGASDIPARTMERALNDHLREAASSTSYATRREPPKLVPAADGGYDYTHRADDGAVLVFRVHIDPDGDVHFQDGANVQTAPIPIAGTFDITDALHSGEPYAAEKRWFLEQTAELRGRLVAAARATESQRAQRALIGAFEDILASSRTPKAKRLAVVELWLDCGSAMDPAAARATVEKWVRERMPQNSQLGFPAEELEALNQNLAFASRFDPYQRVP